MSLDNFSKFITSFLLPAILFAQPAQAQAPLPGPADQAPEAAVNQAVIHNAGPPETAERKTDPRRAPDPPPMQTPRPRGSGIPKPPLAWRARPTKLAFDDKKGGADNKPGEGKVAAARSYAATPGDTLMLILTSCPEAGLKVVSVNSATGQIVAAPINADNFKMVFSVRSEGATSSSVSVTMQPESTAARYCSRLMFMRLSEALGCRGSI